MISKHKTRSSYRKSGFLAMMASISTPLPQKRCQLSTVNYQLSICNFRGFRDRRRERDCEEMSAPDRLYLLLW